MKNFSTADWSQIEKKGISKEKVASQLQTFKEGIPFVRLHAAAVIGNGILSFSQEEQAKLISSYAKNSTTLSLLKFVPASGAASRMFKATFNFLEAFNPAAESLETYCSRTSDEAMQQFADNIERFPFYDFLQSRVKGPFASKGHQIHAFVKELLTEDGLNYGFFPKGLLPFHMYEKESATPFKEHLKEGVRYAKGADQVKLHFTVSEQHELMFKEEQEQAIASFSQGQNQFKISYSNQKPSTDTIAVDMDNIPFRNSDDTILFRPGGHGALIENLNDQDADIIFIKNIDNVVVEQNLEAVANSKKMLAGLLLEVQSKAHAFARILEQEKLSSEKLEQIKQFLEEELNVRFPEDFAEKDLEQQQEQISKAINRPIRICGMVKNEGEPGGGPFWIKDNQENISLQIVEAAQIDKSVANQASILENATHFNPVDLVCGVRNHKGEKYNLLNYVDPKQGFITSKTKEGKDLKALELPGLWNGAMAFWNTLFVEVPLITFNPVKTVNDLLKPSHQA